MDFIEINDLKINSGSISFRAEKNKESVAIKVLQKTEDVDVVVKL